MSFVCQPYVLVCHSHVICMSLLCARTVHLCTCMPFACHSYVLVCYMYVTRMYLNVMICHSYVIVCHPYVTRMYLYVIRMSLVCGFTIEPETLATSWSFLVTISQTRIRMRLKRSL